MLEVWRATTALDVATSTSSPSSAQAVAHADQLNAILGTGGRAPGCAHVINGPHVRPRRPPGSPCTSVCAFLLFTASSCTLARQAERRSVMPEVLTTTHLTATPLAGHIGAEIGGADTGAPLADDVVAQIRQALLDHKVVFLRGQSLDYRR